MGFSIYLDSTWAFAEEFFLGDTRADDDTENSYNDTPNDFRRV